MRIVIELKRDANPHIILNRLFKNTQLQETFSIIMIALTGGEPKILNLYEMLDQYLLHQKEVVTRRTQFDLRKAEARAHILEGLKIALDNIDAIIKIIRESYNDAKQVWRHLVCKIRPKLFLICGLQDSRGLSAKRLRMNIKICLKKLHGIKRYWLMKSS